MNATTVTFNHIHKDSFFEHQIEEKIRQCGPRRAMYFCFDAANQVFSCIYSSDQKPIYRCKVTEDFAEEILNYLKAKNGMKFRTLKGVEGSYEAEYFNPAYYHV